jgi:hypothetical protein
MSKQHMKESHNKQPSYFDSQKERANTRESAEKRFSDPTLLSQSLKKLFEKASQDILSQKLNYDKKDFSIKIKVTLKSPKRADEHKTAEEPKKPIRSPFNENDRFLCELKNSDPIPIINKEDMERYHQLLQKSKSDLANL